MKKLLLSLCFVALAGCSADLSKLTKLDENSTAKAKIKACLLNEANTRFQAGTLFDNTATQTAKDMVSVCVKTLALESAGLSETSVSVAEVIIQNLQNKAN